METGETEREEETEGMEKGEGEREVVREGKVTEGEVMEGEKEGETEGWEREGEEREEETEEGTEEGMEEGVGKRRSEEPWQRALAPDIRPPGPGCESCYTEMTLLLSLSATQLRGFFHLWDQMQECVP